MMKAIYNKILVDIGEPRITDREVNSLSLPINYTNRDIYMNVKKVLVERGIIGNEIQKLYLCAAKDGVDLKNDNKKSYVPSSNILMGGAI
ncbi:MAG: hypothetical protein SOT71_08135 [Romboutsia timonensis]|uniref:hypothetical protein n=1 Tax=Romboutsia timonensis TaxID=1776391 RepID=UPI002A748622|nr:hypothetical protein [Romboutsia timonensis]MDY2882607.1 hypothetical protein [Romboutsia timonensis]